MVSNSKGVKRKRQHFAKRPKRRAQGIASAKQTILIFVQGEVTEKEYFSRLVQERNWQRKVAITIESSSGKDPATMAKYATEHFADYDKIFLVSDVDEFTDEQFAAAVQRTKGRRFRDKLHIVVSNPQFELWLCAHYATMTSGATADYVQNREKEFEILHAPSAKKKQSRKHIRSDFPYQSYKTACKNVNCAEFDEWRQVGHTAIPRMIKLIEEWNQ